MVDEGGFHVVLLKEFPGGSVGSGVGEDIVVCASVDGFFGEEVLSCDRGFVSSSVDKGVSG